MPYLSIQIQETENEVNPTVCSISGRSGRQYSWSDVASPHSIQSPNPGPEQQSRNAAQIVPGTPDYINLPVASPSSASGGDYMNLEGRTQDIPSTYEQLQTQPAYVNLEIEFNKLFVEDNPKEGYIDLGLRDREEPSAYAELQLQRAVYENPAAVNA